MRLNEFGGEKENGKMIAIKMDVCCAKKYWLTGG